MKMSLGWLRRYTNAECTAEELAARITKAGIEAAGVEHRDEGLENIVVGKITAMCKHPDADKLSVCQIDVGSDVAQIVTGAKNVQPGDTVPVAMPGTRLPDGTVIKAARLRGVESGGMLCSAAELNIDPKLLLPEEREGILQLAAEYPAGVTAAKALGLDDPVLEFEPTPNRADCFSVTGLAREASVACGVKFDAPVCECVPALADNSGDSVKVDVENSELSSRFTAKVLRNVKVGSSPEWLKQCLRSAGMRPINNIVDVTNFVMLELGQPMHAYDLDKIQDHKLVVRSARPGEKITTLDDTERVLDEDIIVIADTARALGIAGIMGGLDTEVTAETKNIVMEAAVFNSRAIRRGAKKLGLRSEASARFERGVDIRRITAAQERAAFLLQEMGAVSACTGVVDVYGNPVQPNVISCQPAQINEVLGTGISTGQILEILNTLGIRTEGGENGIVAVAPSWRSDITIMQDLAEEVGRIYGYDNIPMSSPLTGTAYGGQPYAQSVQTQIRAVLAAAGMDEVLNFSFIHPDAFDKLNMPVGSPLRQAIPIMNPIVAEFPMQRTTLADSLLNTLNYNLAHKNENLKLYEIGRVYLAESLPLLTLPKEETGICGVLCGRREQTAWFAGKDTVDFYDVKGIVEQVLLNLKIYNSSFERCENPQYHPGKSCMVVHDGECLGYIGEIHPQVIKNYGIDMPVYMFELNADMLAEKSCANTKYVPVSRQQTVKRDLALVIPAGTESAAVAAAIAAAGCEVYAGMTLFDVYAGGNLPENRKSLGYSLYFRAADRTLTDEEINSAVNGIVKHLQEHFDIEIRMS